KGSFDDTIRGLRYVLAAYKAANREDLIHINSVISGPDYDNTLEKINLFIKQTDWIPDKIPINVSHVSIYSPPQKYIAINSQKEFENAKYFGRDPIFSGTLNTGMRYLMNRILLLPDMRKRSFI